MQKLKHSGTLGDTYIAVCHWVHFGEDIHVDHRTKHMYWEKEIRDIYSLLRHVKNVKINDEGEWGASPWAFLKHKIDEFEPFPNFEFPPSKLDPGEPYIALCPRSGRPDQAGRCISSRETREVIVSADMPVVTPEPGKTTLLEAMGLVAGANMFYGQQGLMSFVALSHMVQSTVYVSNEIEYLAFRARLARPWLKFLNEVKIT